MTVHVDLVTVRNAQQAFAGHEIQSRSPGRWVIGRPAGGSMYLTEIIVLHGGRRLFVGGDIEDAVFAYYSPAVDNEYLGILSWVANSDLGYLCHKLAIGMGIDRFAFDPSIARQDLDCLAREHPDKWHEIDRVRTQAALGHDLMWSAICEEEIGDLCSDTLGCEVPSRVIFARAAVCKLLELLGRVRQP